MGHGGTRRGEHLKRMYADLSMQNDIAEEALEKVNGAILNVCEMAETER